MFFYATRGKFRHGTVARGAQAGQGQADGQRQSRRTPPLSQLHSPKQIRNPKTQTLLGEYLPASRFGSPAWHDCQQRYVLEWCTWHATRPPPVRAWGLARGFYFPLWQPLTPSGKTLVPRWASVNPFGASLNPSGPGQPNILLRRSASARGTLESRWATTLATPCGHLQTEVNTAESIQGAFETFCTPVGTPRATLKLLWPLWNPSGDLRSHAVHF